MERVLVETGGSSEKGRPFLPAAGELGRHMVGHLRVHFSFGWHDFLSSFQFWVKEKQEAFEKISCRVILLWK